MWVKVWLFGMWITAWLRYDQPSEKWARISLDPDANDKCILWDYVWVPGLK